MSHAQIEPVREGRWHPSPSLLSLVFALIGALIAALIWVRISDAPHPDSRSVAVAEETTE